MALKLAQVTCSPGSPEEWEKLMANDALNGGTFVLDKHRLPYWNVNRIVSHCKQARADFILMFITVGLVIIAMVLAFLRMRK